MLPFFLRSRVAFVVLGTNLTRVFFVINASDQRLLCLQNCNFSSTYRVVIVNRRQHEVPIFSIYEGMILQILMRRLLAGQTCLAVQNSSVSGRCILQKCCKLGSEHVPEPRNFLLSADGDCKFAAPKTWPFGAGLKIFLHSCFPRVPGSPPRYHGSFWFFLHRNHG